MAGGEMSIAHSHLNIGMLRPKKLEVMAEVKRIGPDQVVWAQTPYPVPGEGKDLVRRN